MTLTFKNGSVLMFESIVYKYNAKNPSEANGHYTIMANVATDASQQCEAIKAIFNDKENYSEVKVTVPGTVEKEYKYSFTELISVNSTLSATEEMVQIELR